MAEPRNHDPAALVPGREYPRYMYHATHSSKIVSSAKEEVELGDGWSRTYIYQEYPKTKYHWTRAPVPVKNAEQDARLGGGWANPPEAFEPYRRARRGLIAEPNPLRWVDKWTLVELTVSDRRKIQAQLLRAEAVFTQATEPDAGARAAMRQAFVGIAGVLLEAGVLTRELLSKELPTLVWDSALAAGWFRFASETRQDIFPEPLGHYWVWRDDDWHDLFSADIAEWSARLLEVPVQYQELQNVGAPSSGPDHDSAFSIGARRLAAVNSYKEEWKCSEGALARAARVDRGDLSKWKKDALPTGSSKKARIEDVLKNNKEPIPPRNAINKA